MFKNMELTAKTDKEMEKIGQNLSDRLKSGDILCLTGNLGAGKTTLVKGLARGFNIKKEITSPTFALMRVYDTKISKHKNTKTFVHIDTYRLNNEQELIDIGAEDYLSKPDTICVIEWPEKIKKLLKNKKIVSVTIKHLSNGGRKIIL
ncbi:MAG: tRNA (adenosine(37)-N6)-threonylcarbamoyltransferase complex ATPase subunit type 1 TsaE [Candidatus Magasanikbacteria bacterium CG10_big_fil_rev_8_21_14_0_10_36_32]|uniref:tRNA threonylcarbamoyladenosine biosynthesis protein TsaE n=1 Tax=Candidatus Magasanikbacteria bacterium CG10_big_fil_rev_8_21_14_0_10_36_32 TaxID=1974646 RepID=A0A2M6W5W2_9BACT|nr:MAG: tRNA (adenosine(37)-N6)-threonylcarbamoyltransferase complex ATPase subunit type 1 TsaE [Candidatus Magasanikbacteria bacterium CG10_big_fil_rev_8_21_14_0_10_36_32]